MNKIKNMRGITLIALVITIIVLLILAGVTIATLTGDNGILNQAQKAVVETEISTEKEFINISYTTCVAKNKGNGNVTAEDMQEELNQLAGEGEANVDADGNNLLVTFVSGRVYEIDQNGKISEAEILPPVEDNTPGELDGEGTEENPYKICSIEDLVELSNIANYEGTSLENKYINLDTDLSFTSSSSYVDANRTDMGDINQDGKVEALKTELTTGNGFPSIGLEEEVGFIGNFNGQGYTIKNLKVSNPTYHIGLFGGNFGVIRNLKLENIEFSNNIELSSMNSYIVGGICAVNLGKIENCQLLGEINLKDISDFGGGICGANVGKIENCQLLGEINLKNIRYFGGICGQNVYDSNKIGKISLCENKANINSYFDGKAAIRVSGISCENEGDIEFCSNFGNIKAQNNYGKETSKARIAEPLTVKVSGIVNNNRGQVNGCYNKGSLEGKGIEDYEISGIVNYNYQGIIKNSYNVGTVKGISLDPHPYGRIGGITAENGEGELFNCYNTGTIQTEGESDDLLIEDLDGKISNYYCLEGILEGENEFVTEKSETYMKSEEFVTVLNQNMDEDSKNIMKFVKDTGTNNGYPIIEIK